MPSAANKIVLNMISQNTKLSRGLVIASYSQDFLKAEFKAGHPQSRGQKFDFKAKAEDQHLSIQVKLSGEEVVKICQHLATLEARIVALL